MGQAKREADEYEAFKETAGMLITMLNLLHDSPTASVPELYEKAKYTTAMLEEAQREREELERKLDKDD